MNFRILNYFLTVAHEKNITKAAEILHITQPTLSRQLMQLETALGVKLFDRDKHKFALTPSGQFLVERAREILNMVEKTTLDIQEQEHNLAGSIAMGAGEYQATEVLAKLIGGFQKQYAAVSFELFTSSADLLQDKLDKGLLDVAIMQAPVDTTNYDYLRLPIRETWCVLMRSDAPLASKNAITASDLSGLPIILPARLQARSEIFNWLSGDITKMSFIGNSNLLANTAVFVEQCGYYGISVQMPLLDEKRFTYRPLTPALHSDILLVWRRDRQQSLALQKFLQFAKCFLSIEQAPI